MASVIEESQILMGAGDVCTLLGIKESTLRKYSLILKNAGYHFHVNEKGQRGYFDQDVIVLKRFLEVKQNRDMTLEQAANAVMAWVNQSNVSVGVIKREEGIDRYSADIKGLKETVQQQTELLQQLTQKMDQQNREYREYINNSLERRDRALMEHMRAMQEAKKEEIHQIEAAREEKRENKGFWRSLLGR